MFSEHLPRIRCKGTSVNKTTLAIEAFTMSPRRQTGRSAMHQDGKSYKEVMHRRAGNITYSQCSPGDNFLVVVCRLAKSTLVLIPLLGVHEILFSFVTDDQVEGFSKLIRLFIQLTLSSFHVSRRLNQDPFALEKPKCP